MLPEYELVYNRYLQEALALDGEEKTILKTDAYNEFRDWPVGGIAPHLRGKVVLVELDEGVASEAQARYSDLEIKVGDIRELDFEENTFDVVLDLSTIDHIPCADTSRVLEEYARVLRPEGNLVVVCWTMLEDDESGGAAQTYHSRERLRSELISRFHIWSEEVLMTDPAGRELVLWKAQSVLR